MARIAFKGGACHTNAEMPPLGAKAPDFTLTKQDLSAASLKDFVGRPIVLNVFPSLDTSVCANSVRRFNEEAARLPGVSVLCISHDLPFAQKRFCGAEGIQHAYVLSGFRHLDFGRKYGLLIVDGPLAGLLARAVLVVDSAGYIRHTQLAPEIAQELDYAAALKALG